MAHGTCTSCTSGLSFPPGTLRVPHLSFRYLTKSASSRPRSYYTVKKNNTRNLDAVNNASWYSTSKVYRYNITQTHSKQLQLHGMGHYTHNYTSGKTLQLLQGKRESTYREIFGRAGASPPSRATGAQFLYVRGHRKRG